MPEPEKLTPAEPRDLADGIAYALRFEGKRVHHADKYMAAIAAARVARHLKRAGFVVMKRPPLGGHFALGRGLEGIVTVLKACGVLGGRLAPRG